MIAIPPKYAVLQVVGYIKGKSAIHIAREGQVLRLLEIRWWDALLTAGA